MKIEYEEHHALTSEEKLSVSGVLGSFYLVIVKNLILVLKG